MSWQIHMGWEPTDRGSSLVRVGPRFEVRLGDGFHNQNKRRGRLCSNYLKWHGRKRRRMGVKFTTENKFDGYNRSPSPSLGMSVLGQPPAIQQWSLKPQSEYRFELEQGESIGIQVCVDLSFEFPSNQPSTEFLDAHS